MNAGTVSPLVIAAGIADYLTEHPVTTMGDDTAYSSSSWDLSQGVPTKNAIRDKIVSIDSAISGKVDKVTGSSLVADTAIANFHAPGSDNQDLSGLVSNNDARLSDARTPLTHTHSYEPANANIQTHVSSAHAPSTAQKNSDITKEEIEAKLTGELTSHTHSSPTWKTGIATKNITDASTTQNIAHGLGRVPKMVWVTGNAVATALTQMTSGCYDGTNHAGLSVCMTEGTTTATTDTIYSSTASEIAFTAAGSTSPYNGANRQTGVITCDATNIIITWTKAGTVASNVVNIIWQCT
jgi:hypothetical protein